MMFCRWQSATSPLDPSEFCTLDHIKQYNNGVSLSWRQIQLALLNTFTVSPVFIIRFETNHEMHHRFDSKSRCSRKHWGENNVKLQCRWQPPLRPISEQIWTHFSTLHHRSRAFDVSWFCVNVPVDVIVRSDMRCVFDLQLLTAGAGMCVCEGGWLKGTDLETQTHVFSCKALLFDDVLFDTVSLHLLLFNLLLFHLSVCLLQVSLTQWSAATTLFRLWV